MERFVRPASIGAGVGLRAPHYDEFLEAQNLEVDWVEVISENFMPWKHFTPGRPIQFLERVRSRSPVALHGVSLSLGTVGTINEDYLRALKSLVQRIQPMVVSDHLCWTGNKNDQLHDLLPLPYTEEAVREVARNIMQVQDFLGRRILIENVSSYIEFAHSEMKEWEFLREIAIRADCGLLVDLNNIYVNSINHGFNIYDYLRAIPKERVGQIHLAGHANRGTHLIDTHDAPVCDEVWKIYDWSVQNWGKVNAMIEWDDKIPTWTRLLEEVKKIGAYRQRKNEKPFALSASI